MDIKSFKIYLNVCHMVNLFITEGPQMDVYQLHTYKNVYVSMYRNSYCRKQCFLSLIYYTFVEILLYTFIWILYTCIWIYPTMHSDSIAPLL